MRLGGIIVFAALVAAPVAAAQPDPLMMKVHIDAFKGPLVPLKGVGQTNVTVTVPCAIAALADNQQATIHVGVTRAPPWAVMTIVPSKLYVSQQSCSGVSTTIPAHLLATATADSPAFTPAAFEVVAWAASPTKNETASANGNVSAEFFSIIDAQVAEPVEIARPSSLVTIPVAITNFGNGDTKLTFAVTNVSGGLTVATPAPLTLQSRQMGGKLYQQAVGVEIQTPAHFGYVNQPGTATLEIHSVYALDSTRVGDATGDSFLITTKGLYVAAPGAGLIVGLAAIGALLLGRGRAP
ncbi:MAG: hypothetical protein ACYDCK_09350 [Thermoplasmatota archaeon]